MMHRFEKKNQNKINVHVCELGFTKKVLIITRSHLTITKIEEIK